VLTWGLLGPGKGIEWAIDAMAGLRDLAPRYLVVGKTHPKVLERHGDSYRASLQQRVDGHGLADLVDLDPSYLGVPELAALVERADVVLLPYDSREQVTSGVLIEAVAAGRPVVSTGFPHAVELLADGTGLVVPQGDAVALEAALRRVLSEPGLANDMATRAARKAPELFWSAVAARYRAIAEQHVSAALADAS
jgi:glycosyltransferase involved in cell wall biosynthesis